MNNNYNNNNSYSLCFRNKIISNNVGLYGWARWPIL